MTRFQPLPPVEVDLLPLVDVFLLVLLVLALASRPGAAPQLAGPSATCLLLGTLLMPELCGARREALAGVLRQAASLAAARPSTRTANGSFRPHAEVCLR